jgi:hypothetical protein
MWNLMMKNIYSLDAGQFLRMDLSLMYTIETRKPEVR